MDRICIRHGSATPEPADLYGYELGICDSDTAIYTRIGTEMVKLASADSAAGRFPAVLITGQTPVASAPPGGLFEDTDGRLKYKNTGGTVYTL